MIISPGSTIPSKTGQVNPSPPGDIPPTYSESEPLVSQIMQPYNTYREPAIKRFFEAFIIAVCIWIGVGIITSGISVQVRRGHGRYYLQDWDWDSGEVGHPLPEDGTIEQCIYGNDWTDNDHLPHSAYPYPYSAHHAFNLPGDIDSLYMLARGSLSHGSIDILPSGEDEDIKINVTVLYHDQDALDQASVCLAHRSPKESDVGIFTPQGNGHRRSQRDLLRFIVDMQIPARHLKKLSTSLPLFHQQLGDFAGHLDFDQVSLKSTNAAIIAKSLRSDDVSIKTTNGMIVVDDLLSTTVSLENTNSAITATHAAADQIYVKSTNGPISGTFNSSSALRLITSNGKIQAEVYLKNAKKGVPTILELRTSNGPIDANLYLSEIDSKEVMKSVPGYEVTADTSNNKINLNVLSSPIDSVVDLKARSSNGPASVTLDSSYEGSFLLTSSILSPSLENTHAEDPTDAGRKRVIEQSTVGRGVLQGTIHWGSKSKAEGGSVEVHTSNSRALLVV